MWRVVSRASPGSGPLPPGAPRRRRGADPAPAPAPAPEGGARPPRASRDGPSRAARRAPRSRAPGGCTCPGARPRPAAGRTGRSSADARGPRRLRPVSPRVSRGGGPLGTREAAGARQARSGEAEALPPGPRVCSEASAPAARRPRVPSAPGTPPPRSPPQPTQPRPAARTDADADDSRRARAPRPRARPRAPALRGTRPAHGALARACPLAPRTRVGSAGLAAGRLAGACGGRCGGGLSASIRLECFALTSASPSRVAPRRRWRGLLRRDPVDRAGGCCLILHWGGRGEAG